MLSLRKKNIILLLLCCFIVVDAQENKNAEDSIVYPMIELSSEKDTVLDFQQVHSDVVDTVALEDTATPQKEKQEGTLEYPVFYHADDSILLDMKTQSVTLYGNANVTYGDIDLSAAYIVFGMQDKTLYAKGAEDDSTGTIIGNPVFKDGNETFESKEMTYNFETKRGIIKEVMTQQGEGYLHGELIKRHPNDQIHIKHGKYTTCDLEHPHFYLYLTKAKVIPDDKIVTGPAYMVVADIPIYILALPFGFFPSTQTATSGILVPEYGEELQRGFFLKDGGYYLAINEYVDLKLLGSIYGNGTWGLGTESNYNVRYRFNGRFNADYFKESIELEDGLERTYRQDLRVTWRHNQDPKANPYSRFSANVNFSTTSYDKNYSYNVNYLNNTKSSNISYNRSWPGGSPFSFSANIRHMQNSRTGNVNFKLPELALNMTRISPFNSKTGEKKWYENFQVSYSASMVNDIHMNDSLLFEKEGWDPMDYNAGFKHDIPINFVYKPIQFRGTPTTFFERFVRKTLTPFQTLTITPSVRYEGVLYTKQFDKYQEREWDTILNQYVHRVETDTVHELTYGQMIKPSVNASISPKLYGMYQFTMERFPVKAIRHVLTPTAGISLSPDISDLMPDYYHTIYDSISNRELQYSIYEGNPYGTPTSPRESGNVSLGLKNNLEMKVRSRNDTVDELKKIILLERFDFNTSYNLFADSLNWSNIRLFASTKLFSNKLNLRANATFDPYAYTLIENIYGRKSGRRINTFYYQETGKLAHLTNFRTNLSYRFDNNTFSFGKEEKEEKNEHKETPYDYFTLPWNINLGYDLTVRKPYDTVIYTQAVSFSGTLNLTKTWRINFNSGYDVERKQLTYTTINITKDLHCWELSFNMSPFGDHRFYFFSLRASSSLLADLKYEKRKNWRDFR